MFRITIGTEAITIEERLVRKFATNVLDMLADPEYDSIDMCSAGIRIDRIRESPEDIEHAKEQEAEIWAENAWLREAEGWNRMPDADDEHERMLEAMDPQIQECRQRYIDELGYCPF